MHEISHRIRRLTALLDHTRGSDRFILAKEVRRLKKRHQQDPRSASTEKALSRLEKRLQRSKEERQWRLDNLPAPTSLPRLPITTRRNEIILTVKNNPVVIISGETGSGKSTQIPKFCLMAGQGVDGKIGCTQPRRIAATTVAHRVARELGETLGRSVGYKIRFKDRCPERAFIKFMTDGILLAEMQGDRFLNEYDTLIVDEAHERSINIDFILGLLKRLIDLRKDLKLIITSATIDTHKFSAAFGQAPVIEVSGRMYPVEVRYLDHDCENDEQDAVPHVDRAAQAVARLSRKRLGGDILVFMPSEQDIRDTCALLEKQSAPGTTVLPLFARLPAGEQKKVFAPNQGRKVIVATNVAETSLTIPGIKYVVDTGLARIAQYNPRSRTTGLPVMPISRSSADQRKGRCGRMENGICIRLYTQADYLERPLFTPPEILRTNLAETILRMAALNMGDVSNFPFIDRPGAKRIQDGRALLRELGALKIRRHEGKTSPGAGATRSAGKSPFVLTSRGRLMAKIPLDPRLSRMLIQARSEDCLAEMVVIVSALSVGDPRYRAPGMSDRSKKAQVDQSQAAFTDPDSDFITLLNIWDHWEAMQAKSNRQKKKFCQDYLLSHRRMREWRDIYRQIGLLCRETGLAPSPSSRIKRTQVGLETFKPAGKRPGNAKAPGQTMGTSFRDPERYAAIHRSLLSGFLTNIARKKDKNIYTAARGKTAMIFPGSGLFNRAGEWIVCAEMVETSRLFARMAANIDPQWLETLGKEHCRYTYLDPHWERKRGDVVANEQVTLFGLIIISGRAVSYGRINSDEAADIFIRSALVEGDIAVKPAFVDHNFARMAEIRKMENKVRRRGLLVDDETVFAFYKQRLAGVFNLQLLQQLIKRRGGDGFLRMGKADLVRHAPDETELSRFPDHLVIEDNRFECIYRYGPDKPDDGVTVKIPSILAAAVPPESMDWVVPGMYREKITALIKGLDKPYRKPLVPVPETVEIIIREMPRVDGALISALGKFIYRRFKVDVPASAWREDRLPAHLKMRISITNNNGKEIQSSRDPALLYCVGTGVKTGREFDAALQRWEKSNVTRWNFGDLSPAVTLTGKHGSRGLFFPGLAPKKSANGCRLRLFRTRSAAVASHKAGVKALAAIHLSKELKFLKKSLQLPRERRALAAGFGGYGKFEGKLYDTVIEQLLAKNIRKEADFLALTEDARREMFVSGKVLWEKSLAVLETYYKTDAGLNRLAAKAAYTPVYIPFLKTLRHELDKLVPENFMTLYTPDRLTHLPRYIQGVAVRAQRGILDLDKDRQKALKVTHYTDILNRRLKALSPVTSVEKRRALEAFFWMIEDYKISVFSQELKTIQPISPKKLNKKLAEIDRMV